MNLISLQMLLQYYEYEHMINFKALYAKVYLL
jgi:hypothetical protein